MSVAFARVQPWQSFTWEKSLTCIHGSLGSHSYGHVDPADVSVLGGRSLKVPER